MGALVGRPMIQQKRQAHVGLDPQPGKVQTEGLDLLGHYHTVPEIRISQSSQGFGDTNAENAQPTGISPELMPRSLSASRTDRSAEAALTQKPTHGTAKVQLPIGKYDSTPAHSAPPSADVCNTVVTAPSRPIERRALGLAGLTLGAPHH
jgi:hypothetical protein